MLEEGKSSEEVAKFIKGPALQEVIKLTERSVYDMVQFDVIDETTLNGTVISSVRNKGGKANLHWNIPGVYTSRLHIWIRDGFYPFKTIHSDFAYIHRKERDSVLQRSARNVWMGGGGDTSEDKNPLWRPLQNISKELGLS